MSHPEFRCELRVQYLPERSNPPEGPYGFAYTVTIRNTGDISAQLVARHWIVTNVMATAKTCAAWRWWANSRC